jgi:hypothetical protein
MAITLDPATKVYSIPQADLSLVSGTLYAADTDVLRIAMNTLLASENYIWMPDSYIHNTEVTVAGTTFARTLSTINGYSITFTPDSQWTARLEGSNNDWFDVENGILNQNQVQVIPTNSAGLIRAVTSISGADLDNIADAVMDELLAGHTTAGTAGKALSDIDTNVAALPSAADNADAVWDESMTGHDTAGTFGERVKSKLLSVAVFLGLK